MTDSRGFLKLTTDFTEHPKLVEAGGDAGWLHVCALAYCSRNLTDGMIPINLVPRLSDRENPKQLASTLLDVCLWHAAGHDCKRCPQPDDRHYVIHDYLEHQTSAAKAKEISEKRAVAGRKGAYAKAAGNLPSNLSSNLPDVGQAVATGKSLAEVEVEVEVHRKKTSSSSRRAERGTRIPDDFAVTADMVAWAQANAPHADGRLQTTKFVNYWRAKAGRDAVKVDWAATWRNWMLKAEEDAIASGRIPIPAPGSDAPPLPPWCGHCGDGGMAARSNARFRLVDGEPCPACHPDTQKASTT